MIIGFAPPTRKRTTEIASLIAFLALAFGSVAGGADERVDRALKEINRVAAAGPFRPAWDSFAHYKVPAWYQDAKLGIFIHWGVYSVPAFGSEWYPRQIYQEGSKEFQHHIETHGPQSKFGYKDFIKMFKAEKFDAGREGWPSKCPTPSLAITHLFYG